MPQYSLVITEKPSVARSIAAILGATHKQNGYLEGNSYLVSWCIGHLIELADPSAYDEKHSKWRIAIVYAIRKQPSAPVKTLSKAQILSY